MTKEPTQQPLIGEYAPKRHTFNEVEKDISNLFDAHFKQINSHEKIDAVSTTLLNCIKRADFSSFLLPCITDFIDRVNEQKYLTHYTFSSFELWLNHFSGLSEEENYQIRAP